MPLTDQSIAALQAYCDEVTNVMVSFTNSGVDTTNLQNLSQVLHGQLQSSMRNPPVPQEAQPAETEPQQSETAAQQSEPAPEHHWSRKKK
jgi:hypothetical protein